MQKRSIPSLLAAVALLLPLLGALTTAAPLRTVSAAAPQGQLMTSFEMVINTAYAGRATHYVYSSGGTIREVFDLPPAAADWATPSNFYEAGWGRNSTAEIYTYSHNGRIRQTSDKMSIPPDATWATISSFEIDDTPGQPVNNPVFRYSMNGSDILTATNAIDIPPNAQWATLASFGTAWVEISNVQYTNYSLSRPIPSVVSFSISSDGGNPQYVKPGDSLTVTLVTDRPIMAPILRMAGRTLFSEGGGTNWQGGLYLFDYNVDEGPIPVSAEFYSMEGAPGSILSATTDGTSFVHDKNAPSLSYTLSPDGPTNQDVTVQITASDAGSGIEIVKMAEGLQDASYFLTGGITFAGSFTADENGAFTAYARDRLGKTTVLPVTIANIDREAPTLTLTPSTTAPTNADIVVTAEAADNVAIGKRAWAEGTRDAAFFKAGNGTSFANAFSVAENGTYTAYVEDTAGNEALATIAVSNLLRQAPTITLTPYPSSPTNRPVAVVIEARPAGEEAGNSLIELRWAKGEHDVAFFAGGGGQDALAAGEFEAEEKGFYSVYARDAVGNEAVERILISNLDSEAPRLTLTPSSTAPTNDSVTIFVSAQDLDSGIESLLWSAQAPLPDVPWPSGEVEDNEFTVETNGTYTVMASDRAGNETLESVEVTNIDREAPTLTLTPSTTAPTNADVAVTASASDNVAIGKRLWAEGTRDAAYFQAGNGASFTDGFTATANGTYTAYVEDTAGNETLATIAVSNLYRQALSIALTPFPIDLTNEPVTVGVEVHPEGEDDGNPLTALRWTKGERDAGFFAAGGGQDALAAGEFDADENGFYSVYARDAAGNEAIASIDILNIDREAPTLTLTPSTTAPTNDSVTVAVNAADGGSGMESVRWSAASPVPDSPWTSSEVIDDEFTVEENGTYTVVATDKAGNETTRQLTVENIFLEAPALSLSPETTEPAGGKVNVSVQAAARGAGNSIADLLWSAGERSLGYFREGLSENITATRQFDAVANGKYTVYVRDAAGNEALGTIEIDNIRRTNAALSSLFAMIGEEKEELAFTPAFDPEQQNYTLKVGKEVSSLTLKALAADEDAAVLVNGKPLVRGESVSIPLSFGVNTIRIVVSAQFPSVQRTYTIEATRESPPSTGGASGSTSTGGTSDLPAPAFTVWVNGKQAKAELNETASGSPDGRLTKELNLEDAAEIAALARQSGDNELRIGPIGEFASPMDAVKLRLSARALSQLSAHNIRLTLDSGVAAYELPARISVATGGELVVELKALRQPKDSERTLSGAGSAGAGGLKAMLVGVPAEVAANVASAASEASWLVLPLPNGLDSAALRKLAVFLENGDGSKSILPGKIRYDSQGRATGIAVRSGASGRAAALQAEPIEVMFERYVSGYAAGRFGPARQVTRAELAAMLVKLSAADGNVRTGDSTAAIFRDVPQEHWAAAAVAEASAAGWMGGKPDGRFSPNDPLTRAELAAVLARWRQVQASGQTRFPDAVSHWAAAAITAAERQGWITGYADGSFRPDQSVTRAEAVTLLNRVLGRPSLPAGGQAWSDVPDSFWAAGAIRSASQTFEALRYLSGEVELIRK
ncbi:hypothetical protein HH215_22165 [Cohnella herbarum]|uniref:SLH domain-containing protein n=1 Tax=Cohnella herbarum TaxID=2728023 RepID=A0A7Z2VMF5_9BACL|nr:hypothetical protein HH215_22165 [Cohnella herbarum]